MTSFFGQAQTRVGQSVPPASVATSMLLENAQPANYGMGQQQEPKRMDTGDWLERTVSQSVTTGSYHLVASPQATTSGTNALAVERRAMEPKIALEQRRSKTVCPYKHSTWAAELTRLGLHPKYPTVVDGFLNGFDLGIPYIFSTYIPPNNPSVTHLPNVYKSTINNEFAAERYIGPFSRAELEAEVGPFQTSPLSFIPKESKPGKYRAIHNFSFPHKPSPKATSINSHINSEDFPCTWGTFSTIVQLIAHLPQGSQASVRDVAEAYRTIPANQSQWPGLVIRLQEENQYAVNVCNNFGLTSAGGVYRMVADAGTDIFSGNGIGPLAKWVDDHIFFRIRRKHLPAYNLSRTKWSQEIRLQGGCKQDGGRLWYKGKTRPDGYPEEFDEDCNFPFQDLSATSPRSAEDQSFAYADADIDALSGLLGICWEPSKSVPFGTKVPYLGFLWDLHARTVCLLEKKRLKYLAAIAEWEEKPTHVLLETQELHGKLQHALMRRRRGSTRGYAPSKDLETGVRRSGATDRRADGATTRTLQLPLRLIPSFRRLRAFSACSDHPKTRQERRVQVIRRAHSESERVVARTALNNTKTTLVVFKSLTARADNSEWYKRLPRVGLVLVRRPCHVGGRPMSCVTLQGPGAGMRGTECADQSPAAEVFKTG